MNEEGGQTPPPGDAGPTGGPPPRDAGPAGEPPPSEEELRRRLEDELRKLRVQDVLLQSVVSLINLTSRRIAKEDEQDLEQARIGIDAVRALTDFLDPEAANQVRNALSELQVAYAKEAGGRPAGEAPPERPAEGEAPTAPSRPPSAGEPKRPSKLWTPPGSE
jgi:hypothetical protein